MKQKYMRITAPLSLACMLMAGMLLTVSCRKEKAVEPSNLDKNYFVIEDNPNDPIDHAIYEFYKNTGIASFYTDTIYKKLISKENENPPRYTYVTLSLNYSPLSDGWAYFERLSSRERIPALLNLLQTEMVPKLPPDRTFPSIFFIDTFSVYINSNIQISHGWSSLHGFNTLGIMVKDVQAMNSEERKMYAASILAGIAEKRINELMSTRIQKEFLSISRAATRSIFPADVDIYFGIPFMYLFPPEMVPPPKSIGFLFYPIFNLSGMLLDNMPRESDDIRGFLTAVFYYTGQEFADLHPNETLLLKKFGIMRDFAKEAGFKLPE
jgi:hypothetical protein